MSVHLPEQHSMDAAGTLFRKGLVVIMMRTHAWNGALGAMFRIATVLTQLAGTITARQALARVAIPMYKAEQAAGQIAIQTALLNVVQKLAMGLEAVEIVHLQTAHL